jgi:hypothetical protein
MMGSHDIPIVIISTHGWKINQQPEISKNIKFHGLHTTQLSLFCSLLSPHKTSTKHKPQYNIPTGTQTDSSK